MKRDTIQALLLLAAVIAMSWVAVATHAPPRALGVETPEEEFSAARAMLHLRVIAERPHPIGSEDNRRVRDYLVAELEALGLETEIQTAPVRRRWMVARTENVVGRLRSPGTSRTGAVLLVAHFDTVPMSPGAGDAGSGVAAILEAVRALTAGPPLSRDVIVLFSNPEEVFLQGGTAFVERHRWMADVGLVINMDPGGSAGPAYMHETKPGNRALIRALARVAPHPIASSLAYGVKKLQGDRNDEFHLFTEAGVPGFNISFIHGDTAYHTPMDHPDNLDPRSLQHLGSYALSIARDLDDPESLVATSSDAVYFNTLGAAFVHYPESWNVLFAVITALLYAAAVVYGLRRRRLHVKGMLTGFLVFGVCLVAAPGLSWVVWKLLQGLTRTADVFLTGNVYRGNALLTGFALIAFALVAVVYGWAFKRWTVADLSLAAMAWWLVLMVVCLFALPGGCFMFTWPLLFGLCAWLVAFATEPGPEFDGRPVLQLAGAVPAILFLAPAIYAIFAVLGMEEAPFLAALAVLPLGLLLPCLRSIDGTLSRWPAAAALAVAVLLGGVAAFTSIHADRPGTDFVIYGLDGDDQQAVWASKSRAREDVQTDTFTEQFFRGETTRGPLADFYPQSSSTFLQGPAPPAALAAPEAELLEETTADGVRTLRLGLRSPRAAPITMVVAFEQPLSWKIDGEPVDCRQVLGVWNYAETGFELTLETTEPELNLLIVDQSYGLPSLPGFQINPRPPELMQEPSGGLIFSDATLVRRTFKF